MKKVLFIPALLFALTLTAAAQNTWRFDQSHTDVGFHVTHLVISEVDGEFSDFEGEVVTTGNSFDGATVNFTVKTASIDTDNEKRDGHLRSDDFFNAEKYPEMVFSSRSMKKVGDNRYKLTGDLTIRDVTRPIELDVVHNGTVKDPWGNTVAGFKITGELNRFDYGLEWNKLMEAGGAVVGEEVRLDIDAEIQKKAGS